VQNATFIRGFDLISDWNWAACSTLAGMVVPDHPYSAAKWSIARVAAVPLPAAGGLLFLALGGLAALGGRKISA
jgi:hypothetical protein